MKFTFATAISTSILLLTSTSIVACQPIKGDAASAEFPIKAISTFSNGTVVGTVTFSQKDPSSDTEVVANISGLSPNSEHGLHIHQFGDFTNGCTSFGPHYNPFNVTHGAPDAPKEKHHPGDFGNVKADDQGVASLTLTLESVKLDGPHSVIGRGIVLHTGVDDLGLGGSPLSKTTGNAGERLACGVIGRASTA